MEMVFWGITANMLLSLKKKNGRIIKMIFYSPRISLTYMSAFKGNGAHRNRIKLQLGHTGILWYSLGLNY